MRIAVIGMGNLGEYLVPGYRALIPQEELSASILGIKGTARGLEEKRSRVPFPIEVRNTGRHLFRFQPDLLIFAPPPEKARELAEEEIRPYYVCRKEQGNALPVLYSFVPDLPAEWFSECMGMPVPAAKIMPSMAEPIGNVSTAALGATLYSLAGPWTNEMEGRLKEFLSPFGEAFLLKDSDVLNLLAVKITSHLVCDLAITVSDAAKEQGALVSTEEIGGVIRASHRQRQKNPPVEIAPVLSRQMPVSLREFLGLLEAAWFKGIEDFTASRSLWIPKEQAQRINHLSFEMNALCVQLEPREKLLRNTRMHATPGGLLELGCRLYHELLERRLWEAVQKAFHGCLDAGFLDLAEGMSFLITLAVCRHGGRKKEIGNSPSREGKK